MADDQVKKLGDAYQRALDSWAKDVGKLTTDLEDLKKKIDAIEPQAKKLKVDWDAIMKKLDGHCDELCSNIKNLPSLDKSDDKDDDQKLKDLAKQLPGWMKRAIDRVQKGGVPVPYPDVKLDKGEIKVTGVKVWVRIP
ncbi:MAG: hypothetical protein ABI699_03620 [Caldimonas sp.]